MGAMKRLLGVVGALSLIGGAAHAQLTSIPAKDATGTVQNLCVYKTGGISTYCQYLFGSNGGSPIPWAMDASGRGYVNVFNLPVDTNGYLKSGVYDAVNDAAVDLTAGTPGAPAGGVVSVQSPGAPISGASGNVANASAVATLSGASGKTTYIGGLYCTASGATAASVVSLTITGLAGGTMTLPFAFPAGATLAATPIGRDFSVALPASAQNTAIVVTLPAGGTGNTNAGCIAYGFQQ